MTQANDTGIRLLYSAERPALTDLSEINLALAPLVTLEIDCFDDRSGWIITYDGAYQHIGSISGAQEGTKVLMQVVGPSQWDMKYEE